MRLGSVTSRALPPSPMVLVPVGSIEQHGPHLPLDTDSAIATAVAFNAAAALRASGHQVVVAPALSYGSSGEHQDFAGTSSIGSGALRHVLIELGRSMGTWAQRLVFVNAHGGNVPVLHRATRQLVAEGRDVMWVACATDEIDLHAGRTETSLMLHLRPEDVRLDLAEIGNTGTLEELLPAMLAGGVKAVATNGVLGDPTGATAEEGSRILARMVTGVVNAVTGSLVTP